MTGRTPADPFGIFLVGTPGLEALLADEAREAGFAAPRLVPGGVETSGGWPEVWRANLVLRGASRVLVRAGSFRALHLAQLDRRARQFPWGDFLRPDRPFRVETVSRRSRIYHAGAATQRIERAIVEELGAPLAATAAEAAVSVKVRIDDDMVTISLDSSGDSLHRRGHKLQVNKAPMRETLAALFLRACGWAPGQAVLDPMCGSGTFLIEAAERAAGLAPGRSRGFAFEALAGFDPAEWDRMRRAAATALPTPGVMAFGSDRDQGAVAMSRANAERAGVAALCAFRQAPVSEVTPPDVAPGLVIVNPPYGTRLGKGSPLFGLYAAFGSTMRARFAGWRVGLVTSDAKLAGATGLDWRDVGPVVPHGGQKVRLYQAGPL